MIARLRISVKQRPWLAGLLLVGWFNLLAQPCMAAVNAPLPDAGHCQHGTDASTLPPCPAMQGGGCEMTTDVNSDVPPPVGVRNTAPIGWLDSAPLPALAAADPASVPAPALHILYCNLRN